MDSLIKTFFGNDKTVSVNDYEVIMTSGFPLWALLLCAAGLGAYAWILYKKETPATSKKRRIILSTLRWATCFLLFLLILQPRIKMDTQQSSRTVLPVLIDISQSMGIVEKKTSDSYLRDVAEASGISVDEVSKSDRLRIVSEILNNKELGLIKDLSEKYAVRLFVFDQETRQLQVENEVITLPEAEGEATGLGPAVRYVEQTLKGLPVSDMIIFTDGIHNKGVSPLEISTMLKEKGIRVFPVGVGMPDNIDMKVRSVNIPELLFKGDDIAVEVTFEGTGIEETELEVVLQLGDKIMKRKMIECRSGLFKEVFVIKPDTKGDFEFRVALEKHRDEYFTGNNEFSKQVSVIDSEIRVLLAVGNPSWEYRYLKGMLDADKRFKTKVFIRSGDLSRSSTDEQFLSSFPF
ncbi:MAG: VWA domain-containing protein, partial [Lentisphaeraceae bacterium]|nr:VWA domain-containing protein [Lentisphaeraceae bacterium]